MSEDTPVTKPVRDCTYEDVELLPAVINGRCYGCCNLGYNPTNGYFRHTARCEQFFSRERLGSCVNQEGERVVVVRRGNDEDMANYIAMKFRVASGELE